MFNVTKSLKKLKEIREEYIPENYMIDRKALEEILIAGQDDEPETMIATACNELMKRVARIEERLARLEEAVKLIQFDNDIEPEKPVMEEKPMVGLRIPDVKPSKPSEFISCSCCGGKQVYIRGKHPKDDNRLVCPTCAVERLEQIQTIADKDYGKAYQA